MRQHLPFARPIRLGGRSLRGPIAAGGVWGPLAVMPLVAVSGYVR